MEYTEMNCNALKAELKMRGIRATGNKAALIERLVADDELKARDAEKITFMIKTLIGSWHTVKIDRNQTILDVKNELDAVMGTPAEKIRLIPMHGKMHAELSNDYAVSDFGSNEVMLDMMIKLR